MARLYVVLGSLPVFALELTGDSMSIGRGRDNDLVLPLPEVASHHATLHLSKEGWTIEAVEGETIRIAGRLVVRGPVPDGTAIGIGGYTLRLKERLETGVEDSSGDGFWPRLHRTGPPAAQEVAPQAADPHVAVVAGPDAGLVAPLAKSVVVLGRSSVCDITLTDPAVSLRHCSLERTAGGIWVRDLRSRNGTFVDGERTKAAKARTGCRIRVGNSMLQLDAARIADGDDGASPIAVTAPHRGLAELVGSSKPMLSVYERISEAAANRLPVLLLGETGTGKDLAARAVHSLSARARGPFVPVNCAAVPRDLLEAELFGHSRGAFTGATVERRGAFLEADRGTIFLDEICEMPLEIQPKLLRILDDGYVPRLGGGGARSDFRVVAASNRPVMQEVAERRFRRDLFYRLAVFQIYMPLLSERAEDIPELVESFLAAADRVTGVAGGGRVRFDERAMAVLREHRWPGNLRELRNFVMRAAVRHSGEILGREAVEALLAEAELPDPPEGTIARRLDEIEREAIRNALRDCHGEKRAAARRLGVAESTLYEKIHKYGLEETRASDGAPYVPHRTPSRH